MDAERAPPLPERAMSAPLIVTLKLDADTFTRFERLRREHFPAKLKIGRDSALT
jgi:hypothetical protein